MELAKAVVEATGVGKKSVIQVIDQYTGNDPAVHKWNFTVLARGAKSFFLLNPAQPVQVVVEQAQVEDDLGDLTI